MKPSDTPLVIEAAICPYRSAAPVWDQHGMVSEAQACLAAGAAIIHHHHDMRFDAGAATDEMLAMGKAVKASHPGALLYPDFLSGAAVQDWLGHVRPLALAGVLDLLPVDPGGAFSGQLDDDGLPVGANKTRFSFDDANHTLGLAHELNLPVAVGVSEPFNLRWALAQHAKGRLPAGSVIKLYFGGEYSLVKIGKRALNFGLPPNKPALDAYLSMLEGTGLAWSVGVLGDALLDTPLARYAVERGGHLRVGIEDAAGRTSLTNSETVAAAVALAGEVGRPVAQSAAAWAALGRPAAPARAAG
ncbi:3-keto-5-aminohexanoate cleavage protein [Massilia putida]|uniref:3-keto-5-aminohexanoate cleavage protein n=1 Tax=Massilia putida TaxID=1141883 RepID=UPI0009529CD7|nr:3-keto-5-aminohexanoate cleavage protein [Massilia putida]